MPSLDDRLLTTPPFRLAGHEVRPSLLEVETAGAVRTLEPKVMGVLCHLVQRAGEAVSRSELLDVGWAETVVGDEVLTRCVSELRKAFGDDARAPTVIGTVPRIGYRLLAPVEWEAAEVAAPPGGGPPDERGGPPDERGGPPDAPAVPVGAPVRRSAKRRWPVALAASLGAAVLLALGAGLTRSSDEPAPARLTARPLTTTPGFEMWPALAPDGSRVAYAGGPERPTDLLVRPVDGGEPLRLATGGDLVLSPRWSPDGERIAYIDLADAYADDEPCVIAVVPALGGPERAVAPCPGGQARAIDWWPDGRSLVVGGHEAGMPTLSRVDVTTGADLALDYDHSQGAVDDAPRVSPDGQRVLFLRLVGGEVPVVSVLDVASGRVTALATGRPMVAGLDWLPDGGVIYTRAQANRGELWRLADADGAAVPERIALAEPGVRPDVAGGKLVFEQWRVEGNLFALDLAQPDTLLPFAASTAFDAHPQISPDGQRVAFVSERSGTPQVWVSERDGSRPRAVTDLDGVAYSAPRWSPDGERLVFTVLGDDGSDVFVLDRLGATPRRLAAPGSNEVQPAWSADGRWLYVGSDRSGEMEVWRVPVGGGDGTQLTVGGGVTAQPSPGGGSLYTTRPGTPGLWKRTGDEGEDAAFLPDLAARHITNNWAPAADGVVYVALNEDTGREELRSTSTPTPLAVFPRGGVVYSLAWSPDETFAVVSRIGQREVDLAIAELPAVRRP